MALAAACQQSVPPTTVKAEPTRSAPDVVTEEPELATLLRTDPALAALLDDAKRRRIQVLLAIPREDDGKASLSRLEYRVDAEYVYPASAVKLVVAAAAAQKAEELHAELTTPLRIFEREGARLKTVKTTLAEEMDKALLISDNDSHNRLYEFVGGEELGERIAAMGLTSTRLVHRLGDSGEKKSYAFDLLLSKRAPTSVAQRIGFQPPPLDPIDRVEVGSSHLNDKGELVATPMSFAEKNRMSIRDLQSVLIALMRPELSEGVDLHLSRRMRSELVATIGSLPSERGFPRSLDDANKPLYGAISNALPGHKVRVYGKDGRAYGFTIECSYVVDETTHRSMFVAAAIYANDNGTLNDDRYQYDDIAEPFITHLGEVTARAFLADNADEGQSSGGVANETRAKVTARFARASR